MGVIDQTLDGTTTTVEEWFGMRAGPVSLQIVADGDLDATIETLVSNKSRSGVDGDADAIDIKDAWEAPNGENGGDLVDIDHSEATTQAQFVQAQLLVAEGLGIRVTRTGGSGRVAIFRG